MTIHEIRALLRGVKGKDEQFTALCPAHDDKSNSLSVGVSKDGNKILLKCFAGCGVDRIVESLGISMSDLYTAPKLGGVQSDNKTTYAYRDESGKLLYTKYRIDKYGGGKDFYFEQPNGAKSLKGVKTVPYNLPNVVAAKTVYFVEGEKCADAVNKTGRTATTLHGGANSKWLPEYARYFKDKDVIIIPDNDKPGMEYAKMLAQNIPGSRIIPLPDVAEKGDIYDWLRAGHTMDEVDALPVFDYADSDIKVKTLCAADVTVKPVAWTWQDVFVKGGLNSVQGIAGIGKTFLLCAFSAAASTGGYVQSVNGGMEQLERGKVLYISGDDDISTTIVPRLMSFDVDLSNIVFPDDGLLPPVGSEELDTLFKMVKPTVCILDTLQHFLPKKVDLNSANSTTNALQPLKVLAERYNCAIITIQHISKQSAGGGGGHSVNFGIGSAAVNGLFRSVWTLGRVKDEDGKPGAIRALAPSKTNLVAGDPPCILFELSEESGFLWAGIDHELTAERLYDPLRKSRKEAPARGEAERFITDRLANGAVPSKAMVESATEAGISEETLRDAKKKLNIKSRKIEQVWHWIPNSKIAISPPAKYNGCVGYVGNLEDEHSQDSQDSHNILSGTTWLSSKTPPTIEHSTNAQNTIFRGRV